MKWYFNKRLVYNRANGSRKNMFLFQQNWIKEIVVNINSIGMGYNTKNECLCSTYRSGGRLRASERIVWFMYRIRKNIVNLKALNVSWVKTLLVGGVPCSILYVEENKNKNSNKITFGITWDYIANWFSTRFRFDIRIVIGF